MAYLQSSALIPAPRPEVFAYSSDLKHLPEWLGESIGVAFSSVPGKMTLGAQYEMQLTRFGITRPFVMRIEQYIPQELFVDRQIEGFFEFWLHTQKFEEHDDKKTHLIDIVEYSLPYGLIGSLADDLFVRQDLTRLLQRRYEKIRRHFESSSFQQTPS